MSVSEARWAMKAGPEIKKGNVENKIHMQFNVQRLSKKQKQKKRFSFEGL